jgi:tetratricopeptide (TPR) repeat protein
MPARLSSAWVSARARTYATVAAAAVAAAGLVVTTVAFTRTSVGGASSPHSQTTSSATGRAPALVLDLGLRTDAEAQALRRANALYERGARARAARIFARYESVPAQVGLALARWPNGSVPALERLASAHPESALVLLHLGLARLAGGQESVARVAWRQALARDPDTASALEAESLLNTQMAPGRPPFVPSFAPPASVSRLAGRRQLDALRRDARRGGVRARLLYGSALQRLGRSVSAERELAAAARSAPGNREAQVAAAVGRFTKADPAAAFSRLGPLARRFPRSQSVRFHLGELLLWIRQVRQAKVELRISVRVSPKTALGRTAKQFLVQLEQVR